MPTFDVVIPTYNNLEALKLCLDSLLKQNFKDFKAYVCVDGSTDNTVPYLQSFCASNQQFSWLEYSDRKNRGRSQNRNQILDKISAEYLLFIDADVVCDPNLLQNHYQVLNEFPNSVSLGFVNWMNKEHNLWANYISSRGIGKHNHMDDVPYQYFTTQNTAFKSDCFLKLQGFDPHFREYGGEDTELSFRIYKNFHSKFIFNKKAKVSTESDKSLDQALDLLETFGRENLNYIATKHPDCTKIFHLSLLKGQDLKSILFRSILNLKIYNMSLFIAKHAVKPLSVKFINLCVAYRIKKGFESSYLRKT